MDAKELTKALFEKDKELTELRVRVRNLEEQINRMSLQIKDLSVLENAVNNLYKQVNSMRR